MDGTQSHPLLKAQHLSEVNVMPVIDIELVWHFDVEKCQPESVVGNENFRIDTASRWMDMASKRVNELLLSDDIITRRSEEHTSELQSRGHLVCRLLLEK